MNTTPPPPLPGQDPYVAPPGQFDEPKKKGWGGCLVGCLVAFGICCVLCAGIGVYGYYNFKSFAVKQAKQAVTVVLKDSGLPIEEQNEISKQVSRLGDAYESGELTNEEAGLLVQDVVESKLFGVIALKAVDAKYLQGSGLSVEEKLEAKRVMMRVVRGAIEEKLSKEQLEEIGEHFQIPNPQNPSVKTLKPTMSDEELRAFIVAATEMADEAEIPDEDFDVSIAEEFKKVVDKALAE